MQTDSTSTAVQNNFLNDLNLDTFLSEEYLALSIKIAIILALGLPLLFILRGWARSFFSKKYATHYWS